MNAKIRYHFGMGMITISVIFFLCVTTVFVLSKTSIQIPVLYDFLVKLDPNTFIGIGICSLASLFFIPIWAKIMFKARDEFSYNEFGIKKQDKHYMDSNIRKQIEAKKLEDIERILPEEELKRITKKGSDDPDKDIELLLGLNNVKQQITDIKAKLQFDKKNIDKGSMHMVFAGSPGTGKTTVARIMAGIFYDNYVINENKFIEVDGNYLKGNNAKETALKVKLIIRAAYGGVLFIDEAYALLYNPELGEIAISTLLKEMEDNRDKFVLIMAGYTKEMQVLVRSNPGIASRIKHYIMFEDYNDDELFLIFNKMAKEKGFTVKEETKTRFLNRMHIEQRFDSWGNARTVRNFVDECIDNHSIRFINEHLDKSEKYLLDVQDINENKPQTFV